MKKFKFLIAIVFSLIASSFFTPLFAAPQVSVDGQTIALSEVPYISEGRTFVPLRALGEAIGAEVEWDGYFRGAWVRVDGGETFFALYDAPYENLNTLRAEKNVIQINSEIKNGRMYLPLRAISETTGYKVDWRNNTVFLEKPKTFTNMGRINTTLIEALAAGYTPLGVGSTPMSLIFPELPENAILTDEMMQKAFGGSLSNTVYKPNFERFQNVSTITQQDHKIYVYSGHFSTKTVGNTTVDIASEVGFGRGNLVNIQREHTAADSHHSFYSFSQLHYLTIEPIDGPNELILLAPGGDLEAPTFTAFDQFGKTYKLMLKK